MLASSCKNFFSVSSIKSLEVPWDDLSNQWKLFWWFIYLFIYFLRCLREELHLLEKAVGATMGGGGGGGVMAATS